MKFWESIRIAIRELGGNKMRSILTMLGVIIGVASVITLVSIGEGVKSYISRQVEALGSNLIIVMPGKGGVTGGSLGGTVSNLTFKDARDVEKKSLAVKNAAPIIESGGKVEAVRAVETFINGTTPNYPVVRNAKVARGSFLSQKDIREKRKVAVLGYKVNKRLFGPVNSLGQEIIINDVEFKVIGVMARKGRTLTIDNDDRVFTPISVAEEMFNTDRLSMIFIQAKNSEQVDKAVVETKKVLNKKHDPKDYSISEQKDILKAFRGITRTLTGMLAGIAGVSLIVGGIGIMNIMLVSVTERTREIGIRKAVGAKNRDIMLQFLLESIVISTLGGVLGIFLGIWGSRVLQKVIPNLPTLVNVYSIMIAFSFALLVGLFFGLYPAGKAARMRPIEALRRE